MSEIVNLKAAKNIKNKGTSIELNGEEHILRFTLNAMAELEDKFGSVETAFDEMEKGRFKAIRAVLWAGLLDENPNYTEQEVGSMMDITDMVSLTRALNAAGETDMPNEEEVTTLPN